MNNIKDSLHFHMFDDGGAGEGASSSEGGAADVSTVVYGKQPEDTEGAGQVGADTNGENAQGADLNAEFEELIKGKFKEQYGSHVKSAIDSRFKNQSDNQELVNAYQEATAPLYMLYGIDPGDIEGLHKAIESDDGLYANAAEEEGITAQKFRENMKLKLEAQAGRSMMEEFKRQQEQQRMFAQWDQQAAQLRESVPNFDLGQELANEEFCNALDRGYDVATAFQIAHMQEILSGAMQQSASESKQQAVANFRQKAARPSENGAAKQAAVVRKVDPSKFTNDDIDEILRRVEKGEKIYL